MWEIAIDLSTTASSCLPPNFPTLDEMATLDSPFSTLDPVAEEWQALQPEVVQHVTRVLRTHSYKVSCALAETGQQRVRGRKRSAPHAAEAELSSSDNENGDPTAHINSVSERAANTGTVSRRRSWNRPIGKTTTKLTMRGLAK